MSNNIKGRLFLLEIHDGADYITLGGINTRSLNRSNPVADATSSSTPTASNETEACYTGYSTVTINGSGLIDTRSSASLMAFKVFSTIMNSSNPVANLRLSNTLETYSGNFIATEYDQSGEQAGLIEFTTTFQNEGIIAYA